MPCHGVAEEQIQHFAQMCEEWVEIHEVNVCC